MCYIDNLKWRSNMVMTAEERIQYEMKWYRDYLLMVVDEETVNKIMTLPRDFILRALTYLVGNMYAQDIIAIPEYTESYLESPENLRVIIFLCNNRLIPNPCGYLQEYEGNINKFLKLELVQEEESIVRSLVETSNGVDLVNKFRHFKHVLGSLNNYRSKPLAYASRDLIERAIAYRLVNSTPDVCANSVHEGILINYFKEEIFQMWYDFKAGKFDNLTWHPYMFIRSKYGVGEWGKAIIY
jgi:hypothetical protein